MAAGPLSAHEQRVLDALEADLRRDRRRRPRGSTVALLVLVSVCLMVAGIRTSAPAVIWTLAVVWPLTLVVAFRLLCRWTEP
ncbi:hypothetical protein [Streptomyces sp. CC219B]|uniref:hypothetical protein n=1 Tax=Streptomyces sp. CC219B TaxID=3044574 RepID=UPI0024A8E17B|nr:hypothetical protein [Streptomyces sp. CC219B]